MTTDGRVKFVQRDGEEDMDRNRPGDQMAAKQLIGGISPSPAEAADPSFDLRSSVKKVDSAPA